MRMGFSSLYVKYGVLALGIFMASVFLGMGIGLVLPAQEASPEVASASTMFTPPPFAPSIQKTASNSLESSDALNIVLINSPSPTPVHKTEESYLIAIVGDSMVDTMGENLEYLKTALRDKFPQSEFELYNYGVGAQTIFQGLERFSSSFNYKTRHYPSIPELRPDIIVLASFAYNPLYPFDRDSHWLALGEFVDKARAVTDEVYILAEVAPVGSNFGKGAAETAGWSESQRLEHARKISQLLENATGIANAKGVPIMDVYTPTRVNGEFGDGSYTDEDDNIHPSVKGHELTAKTIANVLSEHL